MTSPCHVFLRPYDVRLSRPSAPVGLGSCCTPAAVTAWRADRQDQHCPQQSERTAGTHSKPRNTRPHSKNFRVPQLQVRVHMSSFVECSKTNQVSISYKTNTSASVLVHVSRCFELTSRTKIILHWLTFHTIGSFFNHRRIYHRLCLLA